MYRHHVGPRVKLCVPREASVPIPLKCIDVTRATSSSFDVMAEKNIDDYWQVDGTENCQICGQAGWIHMVQEATDKEANDIQA